MSARTQLWHQSIADRWKMYAPPVRPSKGEVALCAKWLRRAKQSKKPLRVLILGATPELRDLTASFHCETTLVDVSLPMVLAMTKFMKRKAPEQLVIADWLKAPIRECTFDVVLGDFVIVNIPLYDQSRFLAIIASWLRPKGLLITRHHDVVSELTPAEVAERYAHGVNTFYWAMMMTSYNSRTSVVSTAIGQKNFHRYFTSLPLKARRHLRRLYQRRVFFYPPGKQWWLTPKEKLLSMFKKHFRILAREPGQGHLFASKTPTYILEKI